MINMEIMHFGCCSAEVCSVFDHIASYQHMKYRCHECRDINQTSHSRIVGTFQEEILKKK